MHLSFTCRFFDCRHKSLLEHAHSTVLKMQTSLTSLASRLFFNNPFTLRPSSLPHRTYLSAYTSAFACSRPPSDAGIAIVLATVSPTLTFCVVPLFFLSLSFLLPSPLSQFLPQPTHQQQLSSGPTPRLHLNMHLKSRSWKMNPPQIPLMPFKKQKQKQKQMELSRLRKQQWRQR